jgi:integrase
MASDYMICATASLLLARGRPWGLPIIEKLLGHQQASTTQRYAHWTRTR